MTIPNPEHLLEQAKRLVEPRGKGPTRQVDIRRAISAAYYAVFHFVVREVADQFTPAYLRGSPLHALAYRSIDHRQLAALCKEVRRTTLSPTVSRYLPAAGFSSALREFAGSMLELREKRNAADYDPLLKFRVADAAAVVATAESAISGFRSADADERRTFLTLLVFPVR
ncbi:MAG TPA: hypothetical protein PK694_00570 [Rhodospirillales bacterium]|nr:hypothetical protein [Rhodospirillales bacterium]